MSRTAALRAFRRIPTCGPAGGGLLVLGVLALAGCAPPLDHVDFCVIAARPGTTVNDRGITVPMGTVVALKASPVDTHGDIMDDDIQMTLESGNPGVLGAAPLDHESKSCPGARDVDWYFVLWGVEIGQTTLKVWVGSRIWKEIPVNVTGP